MGRWTQVRWTEAGQVTANLGWPRSADDAQPPEIFFDALRAQGREPEAALFLGQALPRYEVVAWAARAVRELAPPDRTPDGEALKAALLWLQDPSDSRRRAAFEASERAGDGSPQRLCALAVFFSGGSLAPDHLQPVLPPKETAGKFAAAAVIRAAAAGGQPKDALRQALDLGEALARGEGGKA
jgi:hypothetical protein